MRTSARAQLRHACAPGALAALLLAVSLGPAPAGAAASRAAAITPDRYRLRYQPVEFSSADSTKLQGWWLPGPPSAHAIVLVPPHHGTMVDVLPAAREFVSRGFSVLTFDYRDARSEEGGTADSSRYVLFATRWALDMAGALRFARAQLDLDARCFAWGGVYPASAVALAGAARSPESCDGLAIEGVFPSTKEAMRGLGTAVIPEAVQQQNLQVDIRDEPMASASRIRVPVLLVIGTRDSIITPYITNLVMAHTHARRDRFMVPQGGHEGLAATPGYFDQISGWFRKMAALPPGN
jgi:alpha-beta hydrolase superfamily lysophospholipase